MSDLISRKAAIDAFNEQICKEIRKAVQDTIRNLPSAQPERKTGKWIHEGWETSYLRCSACGYRDYTEVHDNFCPNCGAAMEVEHE